MWKKTSVRPQYLFKEKKIFVFGYDADTIEDKNKKNMP